MPAALRFAVAILSFVAVASAQSDAVLPFATLPGGLGAGAPPAAQLKASACAGSGATLVAWEDHRTGAQLTGVSHGADVFATRVDAAGQPLDPVALTLDVAPGEQTHPQVAWNGSVWLVVWTSDAAVPGYANPRLRAARVDPNGVVLDQPPLVLADYALQAADLKAVVANGSEFLVAAEGSGAGGAVEIRGFRVSGAGTVLNPGGTALVSGGYALLFNPALASAGGQYLLAYDDYVGATGWDVRARRFSAALAPLDAAPFGLVATAQTDSRVELASDGAAYYATWEQNNGEVRGSRVTLAGAKLDGAAGVAVSGATAYGPLPKAAWDGATWLVAWTSLGVRAARVSAAGAVLDAGGFPVDGAVSATKSDAVVAGVSGGGFHLAWTDARAANDGTDVYGAFVASDGSSTPGAPWSLSAPAQSAPRAAFGPGSGVVVFRSSFSGASEIRAQRVDAFGRPLDAEPLLVAAGAAVSTPAVAWNGALYLIVWDLGSTGSVQNVLARRMAPDGTFLDAAPFVVCPGYAPDVAAVGDTFLVAAAKASATWPITILPTATRVRGSDGAVLDPAPWNLGGSYARDPRVTAWNGGFYVVWTAPFGLYATSGTVTGAFVPTTGAPAAASGLAIANGGFQYASVAAGPNEAFVVWSSGSNYSNADVLGMRVTAAGPTGAALNVSTAANGQHRPSVAFDGARYVVVWEDYRANTDFADRRADVYAARVTTAGAVLDPTGVALAAPAGPVSAPFVASAGDGRRIVGAATFRGEPAFGAYRVEVGAYRTAGLAAYGAGTPGCAGTVFLDATTAPLSGAPDFALRSDGGPAFGLGLVLVGGVPDFAGSDPYGVGALLHVAPLPGTHFFLTAARDAAGSFVLPAPIPAGFAGLVFYAQAVDLWPAAACLPSPAGLSTSHGLSVTVF